MAQKRARPIGRMVEELTRKGRLFCFLLAFILLTLLYLLLMDTETLLRRKAEIEQSFQAHDDEMKRLQGEHRLIVGLLEKQNPEKPKRLRKVSEPDATDK